MTTPLHHLATAIRARASTPSSLDSPAAILWTDHRAEWRGLLPAARSHIPELLVFGDYRPDDRTGPAIWLRCVVDGTIDLPGAAANRPPIIYLPSVERGRLRAGENCPETLRPLVELMFRGVVWHHPNGRDWSVRAFLTLRADGVPAGPGLDVASDPETGKALSRAIGEVFQTRVDDLRGHRLDANDFNRLVGVDVDRDTLRWMSDPNSIRDQMDDRRWDAFCAEARRELGFDPAAAADVEAGARLAGGKGRWGDVWSRFNEAPEQFRGVAEVLGRSRPSGVLVLEGRDRWPDLNEEDEQSVHDALAELPDLAQADACRTVQQLEKDHGPRRGWVWARLGCSPLAEVLRPLACLAAATEKSIGGASPDDIARVYAERGWQADRSAREALALAPAEHEAGVAAAIRHLHAPWLDESAQAFQTAVTAHPLPSAAPSEAGTGPVTATEGECVVFVDGLRYELGRCLADRLEECGRIATVQPRWAAIPTVTATAKPAVTPVAGDIAGDHLGADFGPVFRSSRRPVTATALRDAMKQRGYEIVGDGALELGPAPGAQGWLETGEIDRHGHHFGATEFAQRVNEELDRLVHRVTRLLDAGWRSVRIVTDHGWLLLPGGLPMVTLPRHLTASKWARCAVLAGGARPEVPLHPWHWNQNEYFASPAGTACFSQQPEYAHGGLSVQECLTPEIRIREKTGADGAMGHVGGTRAAIRSVSWVRMRCIVVVEAFGAPVSVDLRLSGATAESVALAPKSPDDDGIARLVLADDDHEDAALVVIVTDADGRILAQQPTRKGDRP